MVIALRVVCVERSGGGERFISIKSFWLLVVVAPQSGSEQLFPPPESPSCPFLDSLFLLFLLFLQTSSSQTPARRLELEMSPDSPQQAQGVVARAPRCFGASSPIKVTGAALTPADESGRSPPRLHRVHETLFCHALACACPPAKALSWLAARPTPDSPGSLEGNGRRAQNGRRCHCAVLLDKWKMAAL